MTSSDDERGIATFAVLDLETSNLPAEYFNKCSITELSIYAFAAKHLQEATSVSAERYTAQDGSRLAKPPLLPRVLHKITLMVNPLRMIPPDTTKLTGLDNEMLCDESSFDKNAANTVLGFLAHLPKPVCLVAHNGWFFDFPVLKYVFAKVDMSLPTELLCVDSLRAFMEIDEERATGTKPSVQRQPLETSVTDSLLDNANTNWQAINETTPKRLTSSTKRMRLNVDHKEDEEDGHAAVQDVPVKRHSPLKARRSLFCDTGQPVRKYPPRGLYKLGNLYRRTFGDCQSVDSRLHNAEGDVVVLTRLLLHYGLDFLAYAEERAKSIADVPRLGASSN